MARISRTFARPRHIARAPPASGPRPKLSLEDVELLSKKMQEAYGWDGPPKPFQLAGIQAQLEGHDIIIQASTGAGKTAVAAGPHLWPSSAGKTTIMVCPLLSLEEEMVRTFDLEFGLKAVAVNSKNGACSPLVLRRILSGVYHIVLISPEMLQSRMFVKKVLRNSKFTRRILSVIVDEAHCISHWGADFRKKYGTLGIIRAFLPRGTPVIALSATLTPRVRRDVTSKLHFPKGGGSFLNIGNDRPNISLVVRACEHPMNSYTDLDFVIPANISSPADVPKTYIYADNINTGTEITEYLVALLRSRTDTSDADAEAAVRPFNATMSHSYRTDAMEAFRSGSVRILVCTDAAGMGCNISDVDIVVQWKLPLTLSNFVQRAGRAARSPSRIGLAVLLVEPSVYSSQDPTQPRTSRSRRKRGKGAMKTQDGAESQEASTRATAQDTKTRRSEARLYAEAHGLKQGSSTGLHDAAPTAPEQPRLDPDAVDEGLLTFVQSIKCRRKVWAAVYETADVMSTPTVPCCDICHPALFDRTRPASTSRAASTKAPRRGQPAVEFQPRLEAWREAVYARDHHGAQFDHTAILDDGLIDQLTSVGPVSRPKLARILQSSWVWWDEYGDELAVLMEPWVIPFIPKAKKGAASPEEVRNDAGVGSAPPSKRPAKAAPSTQRAPKRPCYETPQEIEEAMASVTIQWDTPMVTHEASRAGYATGGNPQHTGEWEIQTQTAWHAQELEQERLELEQEQRAQASSQAHPTPPPADAPSLCPLTIQKPKPRPRPVRRAPSGPELALPATTSTSTSSAVQLPRAPILPSIPSADDLLSSPHPPASGNPTPVASVSLFGSFARNFGDTSRSPASTPGSSS